MSQEDDEGSKNILTTTEESKTIRAIGRDTVHRICSGQVVLNLAIAVKELVENAIDAGATSIEIRLKEYGIDLVEVIDNGSGVEECNFEALTLKHHTSKIREFSDLSFVSTLGFRGEALSSLCALSNLTIVTKHTSTECAIKLEYDCNGHIKSKVPCARQVGTTVSLANLFMSLPVRHKDFTKNFKREFTKMLQLLYAYCIISGVRILCTNQTKKNPRATVVSTQGSKSIKENIICVFGIKQSESIVEINLHKPDEKILEEFSVKMLSEDVLPFTFEGYISKCSHGSGRSTSDRQFYYINSRPCEPTKIIKIVNEVYRHFNSNQYPFVCLNITIEQAQIDVNVTPDKRQVFIEKEKLLLATLKTSILEIFKDSPSTFKMQNLDVRGEKITSDIDKKSPLGILKQFNKNSETILNKNVRGVKRNQESPKFKGIMSFIYDKRLKISEDVKQELSDNSGSDEEKQIKKFIKESYNSDDSDTETISKKVINDVDNFLEQSLSDLAKNNSSCKLDIDLFKKEKDISPNGEHSKCQIPTIIPKEQHDNKLNIMDSTVKKEIKNRDAIMTVDTSIEAITELIDKNSLKSNNSKSTIVKFRSEITSQNAENELQKQISKDMFKSMEVIGQFNKGFIITRLDSDLFIIDQHASDEKYNFETLQQTTVLENQKLVIPKSLELTAANECLLIDNLDVFTKNGFTFNIDENAEARQKVSLTAIPVSKNYQFGKEDIDELLFMLQEDSLTTICRPSRVRAMFASRACRKSVMVGSVLSKNDMRKLVDHMGQIDQPWNCPHGRPTMRHLINMDLIQESAVTK